MGVDKFSARILKIAAPAIAPFVAKLMNRSIETCVFPLENGKGDPAVQVWRSRRSQQLSTDFGLTDSVKAFRKARAYSSLHLFKRQ